MILRDCFVNNFFSCFSVFTGESQVNGQKHRKLQFFSSSFFFLFLNVFLWSAPKHPQPNRMASCERTNDDVIFFRWKMHSIEAQRNGKKNKIIYWCLSFLKWRNIGRTNGGVWVCVCMGVCDTHYAIMTMMTRMGLHKL